MTEVDSTNAKIENEMNITVVFPDGEMPQPTNGGFGTQDNFRKFLLEHDNGQWQTHIQANSTVERKQDYEKDVIAQAFPLQFPFGFSGLPGDKAHDKMLEIHGPKPFLSRTREGVLRKLLQHRKACFHSPHFNLVVENIIMKQIIFESARLNCFVTRQGAVTMAENFGEMKATKLATAIDDNRKKDPIMHSAQPEYQFLKSITATCRVLPHTNEASKANRQIYFSFLMKFGLPCIFLTVTPDDSRSFRIILYALDGRHGFGMNPDELSDAAILADFKIRQDTRMNFPGLCAEEYSRIMDLVIKHVFGWDINSNEDKKMGLFGEVIAWCLATEEQGRKTLHGHFLIFLKNWNKVLEVLHNKGDLPRHDGGSIIKYQQARLTTRKLYDTVCSAKLFKDFKAVCGETSNTDAVFSHSCPTPTRQQAARVSIQETEDQVLRDMRHKQKCLLLNGVLGTCMVCGRGFTVQHIVTRALNIHHGVTGIYEYPDHNKRLDAKVYEMGMDMDWMDSESTDQDRRYFTCNALVNLHSVTHARRCFKKGCECYANLPDKVCERTDFNYNEDPDIWYDYLGHQTNKFMFKICPERAAEDAFMNSHNPALTKILGCNTNVMVAMNGSSVFYVTGYNAKSTQKEEKAAFEIISSVMVKHLEKQVRNHYVVFYSFM